MWDTDASGIEEYKEHMRVCEFSFKYCPDFMRLTPELKLFVFMSVPFTCNCTGRPVNITPTLFVHNW